MERMRLLVLLLVACSANHIPLYGSSALDLPVSSDRGRVLVLIAQGEHFDETAAFLSAVCNWISSTPAASASYSAVWIGTNRKEDTLADAATSLSELTKTIVSSKHPESIELRWAKEKTLDLASVSVRAHLCFGQRTVEASSITILGASHLDLAPYGAGLRYVAISSDKEPARGFVKLNSRSLERDIRHFSAVVMRSPDQAVSVEARVKVPPEERCTSAGAFCMYQPSTAQIEFAFHDSPFVAASEVVAAVPSEWAVLSEDGARADGMYDASFHPQQSGLHVDIHFRRPGRYRLRGSFGIAGVSDALREIDLPFSVEPQGVLVQANGTDNPLSVLDDTHVIKLGRRPSASSGGSQTVEIETACVTIAIFCRDPRNDSVWSESARARGRLRMISASQFSKLVGRVIDAVIATVPAKAEDPDEWKLAIQAALSDDQVRSLVDESHSNGWYGVVRWCSEVTQYVTEELRNTKGLTVDPFATVRWTEECSGKLHTLLRDDEFRGGAVDRIRGWHTGGAFLVDTQRRDLGTLDHPPVERGDIAGAFNLSLWVSLHGHGLRTKGHQEEDLSLAGVDNEGKSSAPVDATVKFLGGRPFLSITGMLLAEASNNDAAAGFRISATAYEGLRLLVDTVYLNNTTRTGIGVSVAPWCLYVPTSSIARTLCRKEILEPEIMWNVHHGLAFGASLSGELYQFPAGIGVTAGARVVLNGRSFDEVEPWVGLSVAAF